MFIKNNNFDHFFDIQTSDRKRFSIHIKANGMTKNLK